MDAALEERNAAMIKKALKTLTSEQLAYALDTGVRFLDAWRVPVRAKLPSSDDPAHIVAPWQLRPSSMGPNHLIRSNRKQPSQD